MTPDSSLTPDMRADLDSALDLARQGRDGPLLGGPIGLMWGVLLFAVFGLQYLILERVLDWPLSSLGYLWIAFALVGGLGVFLLSRRQDDMPGAQSIANRVESHVWIMFSAAIASLLVGVIANQLFSGGTPRLWDLVLVFGFAGQATAYGVVARMTGRGWVALASLAAALGAILSMAVYGSNAIYAVGAVMVVPAIILPSLVSMRAVK